MNASSSTSYSAFFDSRSVTEGSDKIIVFPGSYSVSKDLTDRRKPLWKVGREAAVWETLLYSLLALSAVGAIAAVLANPA